MIDQPLNGGEKKKATTTTTTTTQEDEWTRDTFCTVQEG